MRLTWKTWLALVALFLTLLPSSVLAAGNQSLDIGMSYAAPAGEVSDDFHLDPGPGIDVRYGYALSERVALGAVFQGHWFEGSGGTRGSDYTDRRDDTGRVLSAGLFVRVVFNPGARFRVTTSLARIHSKVEMEERYAFRQGEFSDDGSVSLKAYTRLAEAELGGEIPLSDSLLLRAALSYGYFATDLTQASLRFGVGYRF